MDFTLTERQQAVADLAAEVLGAAGDGQAPGEQELLAGFGFSGAVRAE